MLAEPERATANADDQCGSLEDMVVNEFGEGQEAEAITAWLEANPGAFSTQR